MRQVLEALSGPHLRSVLEQTARTRRVLVVGAINYDELFLLPDRLGNDRAWHVGEKRVLPGGHAGNCASALAQLGLETALCGAVGDDAFGHFLLDDLSARGVDTSLVRMSAEPTGRAIIPVFEDGHFMLLERGANDTLSEVPAGVLEDYDAIALFDPPLAVLQQVSSHAHASRSAPPCFWTPGGHFSGHPQAGDIARNLHCIFLNGAEAARMAGSFAPPSPSSLASPSVSAGNAGHLVVETRGHEGAACRCAGREVFVPAFAASCVDPTGAGDLFASCFILADLAGLPIETRLAVANTGGMIAVESVGARSDHFSLPVLSERLERNGVEA